MVDVPAAMANPNVTKPVLFGVDWKGLGYLFSIASVFLLGAIAWPKPDAPRWHLAALIAGVVTSVTGMGFRYKAHLDQQRELKRTEAEAAKKR